MSVQDLARSLVAAGSARFPNDEEEQVYLAHVRDGNLVEKLWVGDDAKSEGVIATDAKEDTTVSYLFNAGQGLVSLSSSSRKFIRNQTDTPSNGRIQRLAVFIDQSNTVQCYAYNEEIEEWEQTGLGKKWNITTSPNSKLSASFGPKGSVVVSYQDTAGRLAGVMSVAEDKWEPFTHPEADPVAGTPQCLENIDDKMHLFYVRNDGSLRYLVLNYDTGKWQGESSRSDDCELCPFVCQEKLWLTFEGNTLPLC